VSTPPPTTNAAPRIRRVTLTTARMADEQAWWTGRLGLEPALGAPARGFAVRVGDGVLAFQPVGDERHGRGAEPSHHVALEVAEERLVEAAEWLGRAAPLIPLRDGETIVDFSAWVAHSVYAESPSGHVIELIARHRRPWRPDGDRPDGPALVRGISEVGIPAPDVGALVDRLEALGLSRWFGDPASGFAAVGDESGLLICAREWRPWFPTDRPAAPGPIAVELHGVSGLTLGQPVPVGSATELWAVPW
jgi:catechol 2,3-dioxygenase-like lactoylglutathione lyase family enzyme